MNKKDFRTLATELLNGTTSNADADKTLGAWLNAHAVPVAVRNRGDAFESALTKKPVNNSGLNVISTGDAKLNGEPVEIKLICSKTPASDQLKGTTCKKYVIGFYDSQKLIIKVINKNDLVVNNGKIKFNDNINKGYELKENELKNITPLE